MGPPVLSKDFGGFVDADKGEAGAVGCFDGRLKPLPGGDSEVLGGGNPFGRGELRDFEIEVTMIPGCENFFFDDGLETLEIDYESGGWVGLACDRDLERVIVAVAIAVAAAAEDLLVLLRGPTLIPVVVGGRERRSSGQEDHFGL